MGVGVLVVDDLPFITRSLRKILEDAGFRVIGEAADGKQALDLFLLRRPDVVMMDITMPQMDGLASLKKMREADPDARVVMFSALGQQRLIDAAKQLGARAFLVKPLTAQQVVGAIKDVLEIT